jgi:rubrerythrin
MVTVIDNLKEAIIGESTAKMKYELYSDKAQEENQPEIAHLFKTIAYAESIHIRNHLKALSKISEKEIKADDIVNLDQNEIKKEVNNTRNNLIQAIAGETYEFKTMYKGFIKNAKNEDLFLAEYSFDLARKAEKVHSKLFIKYLKMLDKNKSFDEIAIFVCTICGNVELGEAPNVCPNCEHDQKFFEKI